MKDVPETLSPLSILVEVCEQLDSLKSDLAEVRQNEEEYASVLKAIKHGDQIQKCSSTLSLLLTTTQEYASQNESMKAKIE